MHESMISPISLSPTMERKVLVGAWVGGFWDNDTKKLNTQPVTVLESEIGKKFAIVNIYSEWAYLANPKLLISLNTIADNGWTPIISANPYFFSECPRGNANLYKTIASGACDKFLTDAANNLKSYQKPILFRFAWEMNLPDMYWSVDKENSTPQDFILAWRHMHDIFQKESVKNVQWVLSFNTSSDSTIPYAKLFPGDAYIDWVAIDGYNWGNTHDWSKWTNFNGVFRNSYNELTSLTEKPVMLSEVNSSPTGTGGDKAVWLHDMLAVQVPNNFSQVGAIIFFNENKSSGEKVDWRMEKSPEYLSVLKKDLQLPLYKSSLE